MSCHGLVLVDALLLVLHQPGPLVITGVAGLERALPQAVDLDMLVQEGKVCSCFLGLVLLVFVGVVFVGLLKSFSSKT